MTGGEGSRSVQGCSLMLIHGYIINDENWKIERQDLKMEFQINLTIIMFVELAPQDTYFKKLT